ncbi:MAG TPA: SprT family zinc-dependent metalloprotease [Pseudolabrys sp.]|nr:SprT family zinc-dependent metalloprotease [Pseudolabrys sp.]
MSIPLRAWLFRDPSEPSTITIEFDGEVHRIRLRRRKQARRYTLRIHSASREVVLSLPPRGSLKQAHEFALKNAAWIATRLRRLPDAVPFAHGVRVPLRGIEHRIDHRADARGAVWIEKHGCEHLICVAGGEAHLSRRVRDFLKREARHDLTFASHSASDALGVRIRRVSVRDQTSRWGSCSSTGVLSYSWRLILAPSFVLEYLAAHEVAHLIEMNHSRRFWCLVERICPHVSRAKAWLDAHGSDLHRYGLEAG